MPSPCSGLGSRSFSFRSPCASSEPPPAERNELPLVLLVAVGLNLAKILHDPLGVTFTDEFAAWRNVIQLTSTGHLFSFNPLHPASAFYPGLPTAIGTVSTIGGIGFAQAGFMVIMAGRFLRIAALALFLFLEDVSGSPRLAGIATLVYAANPNFLVLRVAGRVRVAGPAAWASCRSTWSRGVATCTACRPRRCPSSHS